MWFGLPHVLGRIKYVTTLNTILKGGGRLLNFFWPPSLFIRRNARCNNVMGKWTSPTTILLQGVRQRIDNTRDDMCENMCTSHLHRQQSHHIWDYPYDQRPVAFFFSVWRCKQLLAFSDKICHSFFAHASLCPYAKQMTLTIVYKYCVGAKM